MVANRKVPFRHLYWLQSAQVLSTKNPNKRSGTRDIALKGVSLFATMGRSYRWLSLNSFRPSEMVTFGS